MIYSKRYRERTIEYRQAGHSLEATHQVFKVSKSTIQKWEKQLKETGTLEKKDLRRNIAVLLDIEGGKYILAMRSELLQELLDEENISGAASVVRKLYEAAEIPSEKSVLDGGNNAAWFSLFSGALKDTIEDAVP